MKPRVCIILPTYNRAHILWRAIQSVLAQTDARWELIIVDDGSTDCTQRMLEEFRDPRIKIVETDNRGPSVARSRGIELAGGEFVAYLDSDNAWHADFLEKTAKRRSPGGATCWASGVRTRTSMRGTSLT